MRSLTNWTVSLAVIVLASTIVTSFAGCFSKATSEVGSGGLAVGLSIQSNGSNEDQALYRLKEPMSSEYERSADAHYVHERAMRIPFRLDPDALADIQTIQLLVSRAGGPWEQYTEAPADGTAWENSANVAAGDRCFIFRADADGEYRFAIRTVRKDGEQVPHDDKELETDLRVVIDTTPRQHAEVQDDQTASGEWPMFRGNSLLTGVATSNLPEKLTLLWTYQAEGKGESIESSAAIVDGVAYIGSIGGYLHAINLSDGKLRWKYATDEPGGANTLLPAIKSSPAVADAKVFFGDEVGVFHCLDAGSGKLVWKYDTSTGAEIISSANVIGDRVLFGSWDENLYCLAVADGKELWKFKTGGPVNCTPAVVEGKTFLSGCDAQLRVVNIEDGSEVGSCEMESQTGASPAVLGDRLFVGHMGSQVLAIDWKKPEIVWRYQHPDRQFEYYSSAAATSELVIIGGRDKMIHALDPKTGESKWTFLTKGRVDSSPVIVGNRVFFGSQDGNVYGLDTASGKEVWRFAAGGKITASPAVASGRLVIGNDEGKVFCFGEKR